MEKVESIEQLKELILYVRNLRQGFVTNFYLDEEKHAAWIRIGEFLFDKREDTVFLLFDHYAPDNERYFTNLFYISTSEEAMLAHLKEYPEKYIYDLYVLDIIGRNTICLPLVEKLKEMRGYNDVTLVRMIRIGDPIDNRAIPSANIVYAKKDDVEWVNEMLHTHFDEQMEQLPLIEELEKMVEKRHILLCKRNEKNAGIILFDKNTTTIHWRYWLVLPEYRNMGVGSELVYHLLWEGRDTKRQILWVRLDNVNAMERHEHYGFKKENMYDYIIKFC